MNIIKIVKFPGFRLTFIRFSRSKCIISSLQAKEQRASGKRAHEEGGKPTVSWFNPAIQFCRSKTWTRAPTHKPSTTQIDCAALLANWLLLTWLASNLWSRFCVTLVSFSSFACQREKATSASCSCFNGALYRTTVVCSLGCAKLMRLRWLCSRANERSYLQNFVHHQTPSRKEQVSDTKLMMLMIEF